MGRVRVRFAQSQSEHLHVGNARVALCNYIFAKKFDGDFVIRIEDTDQDRNVEEAIDELISDLRWFNIDWNEGPNIGGIYGPYRQSLRNKLYQEKLNELIDKGLVYPCYCTKDDLEQQRNLALSRGQVSRYDNRCRFLDEVQKLQYENEGRRPVWRFKVEPQHLTIYDLIRGEITFDTGLMGDFIIMKADQTPAPLFSVTVDDAVMKITHVIRTEDHLSNTPRHVLLFKALDYEIPQFAHMALLQGVDNEPLCRHDLRDYYSVEGLRKKGYLPEAVINYLVNIGISLEDGSEVMSFDELVARFDLGDMSKSAATFDVDKLNWYAGYYIRNAEPARIADLSMAYLKEKQMVEGNLTEDAFEYLIRVVDVIRHNVTCLSEIADYAAVFFQESVEMDSESTRMIRTEESKKILFALVELLEKMDEKLTHDDFHFIIKELYAKTALRGSQLYQPIRRVLTGKSHGPELDDIFVLLGKQRIIQRITTVMKKYEYIDNS
ncbi:MAG: glutamate--tRNA ligase [Candidatus Auribacterota bacterium]|jgi:glutamyl-tRNA synthetase|nr:glutamate--tRNA ligase [Candidatus Auribacterota bacterium]